MRHAICDKYILDEFVGHSNRKKNLAWKTVYNNMSKKNVFNNNKNKNYSENKITTYMKNPKNVIPESTANVAAVATNATTATARAAPPITSPPVASAANKRKKKKETKTCF